MKSAINTLFLIAIFSACREKPVALTEPAFFTYYAASPENMCGDSAVQRSPVKGSVLLLPNNKALYTVRQTDTIQYYRGKYSLTENGLTCTFDGRYGHARNITNKKRKKKEEQPSMKPIQAWSLPLKKTGCSDYAYYSDSKTPRDSSGTAGFYVYGDADAERSFGYITRINKIAALVDFHMEPPRNIAAKQFVPASVTARIEEHYTRRNENNTVARRTENDSIIKLTFSHRKRPKGEPPGPYLFVTIPKKYSASLKGDMNNDHKEDIVVQPLLSQGGGSRWKEFFLFVKEGDDYTFKACASSYDLAQHQPDSYSGTFHPDGIVNNAMVGNSKCYRDEDAQCCPSVKVPTRVRLEKDRLRGERVVSR